MIRIHQMVADARTAKRRWRHSRHTAVEAVALKLYQRAQDRLRHAANDPQATPAQQSLARVELEAIRRGA